MMLNDLITPSHINYKGFPKNNPLILSLIISCVLHFFLFNKILSPLTVYEEKNKTIEIRFLKIAPPNLKKILGTKPPMQKVETPISQIEQTLQSESTKPSATIPNKDLVFSNHKAELIAQTNLNSPPEPSQLTPNTTSIDEAIILAPSEPMTYQHIEVEFEIYNITNSTITGFVSTVFNISENKTYSLVSNIYSANRVDLVENQKSEGVINELGLRPNYYEHQHNMNKNIDHIDFAWSDTISISNSSHGRIVQNLIAGTQDELSFLYQFMFSLPLENQTNTLLKTNGLQTYTYTIQGLELTKTKLGDLKTIHLISREENNKFAKEIWLAIDYQYLPVKIITLYDDSSSFEQVVTKISAILP